MHSILSWITKLPFLISSQSTRSVFITRAWILIFNCLLPSFLPFIVSVPHCKWSISSEGHIWSNAHHHPKKTQHFCPTVHFCWYYKTQIKSNLQRKMFIWLRIIVHHWKKARAGTQTDWSRGHEGMLITGLLLMAYSTYFPIKLRTTCQVSGSTNHSGLGSLILITKQ